VFNEVDKEVQIKLTKTKDQDLVPEQTQHRKKVYTASNINEDAPNMINTQS